MLDVLAGDNLVGAHRMILKISFLPRDLLTDRRCESLCDRILSAE